MNGRVEWGAPWEGEAEIIAGGQTYTFSAVFELKLL